ncbi:hypothetical protein GCM10011313_12380 [Mycetocola zhadangensis]|nr:hypothetical protein GCM10011313_12380 [Mycetocola zhadangensis]
MFRENRSDGSWATFLISPQIVPGSGRAGTVVLPPSAEAGPTCSELVAGLAGVVGASLVGIVREGSNLSRLRVEILPDSQVSSGQVFVVPSSEGPVHYQVAEAETAEESFGGLNYGAHIASATQIGLLKNGRFERFNYLPMMNELVFEWPTPVVELGNDDRRFTLGVVPGTGVSLRGDFVQNLESHTAILGTTGSGKTEFAFDLIRHALQNRVNVICIDLTSQYAPRLSDLDPVQLSISAAQAADLGKRLFEAETGAYGGGAEKKVLDQFAKDIRADIRKALEDFFAGSAGSLGLIELNEISNTKATLWITEMYLSTLLELAREGKTGNNKTVVVVEEAHTVMPEASFSGLGDFDSKGTIAKITQIALQGRKYGVGLLVLAQRTATVSKSVLTQCNTIVSFSCVDDTSINFLRNVYGSTIAEGLPQLPRLRAIAHGLWIDAEQPIAFDVPYDKNKADRKGWALQTQPQPQNGTASTTAAPIALPVSAPMEDAPF